MCYFIFSGAVDAFDPDLKTYPMFEMALSIMFEQLPGEILLKRLEQNEYL